ncbi:hypothetical protein [Acinetobacter sp. WCHAc060025]|uniref:hypothetical protein n=1 Tax=Acinetobacter sp. WCHAc060025 TaxID=2518625 RepID=UPI0010231E33|nr:hypothetical protein [Acinetobacter sp. WCHAc060025]RZG71454.1 hypothetical protein EXE09_18565 [Acinetobacter sp. WCHAc060025]
MNISQSENLKLLNDLLSGMTPIFIGIFILGLITGVFFFSDLVNRLDRLSQRFRCPRRIIVHDQINDVYCYVYRFKGKYYSEHEFKRRRAIALNKFLNKRNLSI